MALSFASYPLKRKPVALYSPPQKRRRVFLKAEHPVKRRRKLARPARRAMLPLLVRGFLASVIVSKYFFIVYNCRHIKQN